MYDNQKLLERNIKISEILLDCNIPVAEVVHTKTGEKYVAHENMYFLMSRKLRGNNISNIKDKTMAWNMGCAIVQLHKAFVKCEREVEFGDNSLLKEMKGWIRKTLTNNEWKILDEEEYLKTAEWLESVKLVLAGYESTVVLSAKEKTQSHV